MTSQLETEMARAKEKAEVIDDLQRPECCRMAAGPYLEKAIALSGKTEKEIRALRERIASLPQVHSFRPLQIFLNALRQHIREHFREPTEFEFPGPNVTGVAPELLAMCLLDIQVSRFDLAAIAALDVIEASPEIFEYGYTSLKEHQDKITTAQEQLQSVLNRAASVWTMDDIEFHSGVATFKISQGRIAVGNGPGDVYAIEQLLVWMRQPKPASTDEEAMPDEQEVEGVEYGNYLRRV